MAHYRLRTHETIIAHQWLQNGDHPDDLFGPDQEGQLVRYFRDPVYMGTDVHGRCKRRYHDHGWIEPKFVHGMKPWESGAMVCPGDYIITQRSWSNGRPQYSVVGERSFDHTYEPVVDLRSVQQINGDPIVYSLSEWESMSKDDQNLAKAGSNGAGVLVIPDEIRAQFGG